MSETVTESVVDDAGPAVANAAAPAAKSSAVTPTTETEPQKTQVPAEKTAPAATEKPAAETAEEPAISEDLYDRARALGLNDRFVKSMGDAEAIDRTLSVMELNAAGVMRGVPQELQEPEPEEEETPAAEPQPPARKTEKAEAASDEEIAALVEELKTAEVDPSIIKAIESLGKSFKGAISERDAVIKELVDFAGNATQREQINTENEFDSSLNKFVGNKPEWKKLFGTGVGRVMRTSAKEQHGKRNELFVEMNTLRQTAAARGWAIPSVEEATRRILLAKYTEEAEQEAKVEEETRERNKKGQYVAKPGGNNGLQKAIPKQEGNVVLDAIRRWQQENVPRR